MVVATESQMDSQNEVESPLIQTEQQQQQHNNKNHPFSSLGRQSSVYSLTLDEFQQSLCESGKNFGSMNMDEFLSSIWNAEENQNQNNNNHNNNHFNLFLSETEKGITRKQPSLPRQVSLTIPAPLCRKTVDEVWSEIQKGQRSQVSQQGNQNNATYNKGVSVGNNNNNSNVQNTESAPRQPSFGEMTLEDFLIKAGVVREQCAMPIHASSHQRHLPQQQYGVYANNNNNKMGASFVGRPAVGIGGGSGGGNVVAPVPPPYQGVAQGGGVIGEGCGYVGNGKRDTAGYPCFGGGGYGAPVSPVSPEGIGVSVGVGERCGGGQFGMEIGVLRGRKRVLDGPVEKVVERRQRRMIKNRESAARSRARKQAYTVELEAELNQLKEENAQLTLALAELERRRKQQHLEEVNGRVQTNAPKVKTKLRSLRRNLSCPL